MPIPAFDQHGLLPIGSHDCSISDVEQVFCWNPHRSDLMAKLKDFLSQRWQPLGVQAPFWVDGSFTRKIEFPNDIDLVADVNDLPAAELAAILPLFCAREQIKTDFKVDFWLKHPFFPNDLTEFFRYAGTKVSAEIGIDPLQRKGILRVQL